jgi:predicted transcriptional regulator
VPLDLEKIRKLIGEKSQAEVATAAGMARPNFARILSGKFDPKLSTVERLAAALGCKVKDLLR